VVLVRNSAPPHVGSSALVTRVFGFDYCDFSDWVQRCIDDRGDSAAEWVSDRIDTAFEHIGSGLRALGYEPVETLGDGLLAVATAAVAVEEKLAALVAGARLGLAFRCAVAFGAVRPVPILDRLTLWSGEGITRCHQAMRRAPRIACPDESPRALRPDPLRPDPLRLVRAEVIDGTVGFLCLRQDDIKLANSAVQDAARLAEASAEASGSRIEKATQDEKGILLRLHFTAMAEANDWARLVAEGLGRDFDFGIGLASGLIYRSTSPDTPPVVHGAAVNRAAKLAGAARGFNSPAIAPPARRVKARSVSSQATALRGQEESEAAHSLAQGATAVELVGDPGLGKTYLLRRLTAVAAHRVAAVSVRPQDVLEPYRTLRSLLRAVAATDADRALCDHRAPTGEAALIAWGEEICAALRGRSADDPLLLAIDDLQWADTWSVKMLESLRGERISLLVARRSGRAPLLVDRSIVLRPLGDAAIRVLLGPLGDDAALVALVGGNPFYAIQLVGAMREGAAVKGFSTADAVIDARLAALDQTDRAILRLAAVAGRPLKPSGLAALAHRAAFLFAPDQLDILVARGFLSESDSRYAVVHQLLADRLLATMPRSLEPVLHQDAARTFLGFMKANNESIAIDEVAAHWAKAGSVSRAGLLYGQAGLNALDRGAHAAALIFLDRAEIFIRHSASGMSRRGLWAASRALAAWGQGDVALCAAEADRAFRQLDGAGRHSAGASRRRARSARLRASVARAEAGHYRGDVRAILGGNLGALRWSSVADDRSSAKARGLAFVATTLGVLRGGMIASFVTRQALRADPSPRAVAYVHAARAVVHLGFGRWNRALDRIDRASLSLLDDLEPQLAEVLLTLTALHHQMTGDLSRARARFEDLGRSGSARANPLIEGWSRYGYGMVLVAEGDFGEARKEIAEARRLFHGRGDLQSELICHGLMAQAMVTKLPGVTLAACHAAKGLAMRLPPTNFGSLEGYSGSVLALARLWQAADQPGERERIRDCYRDLRRPLLGYARIFPIGRPRLAFADALIAEDEGRMAHASRTAASIGMDIDARNMAPGGLWRTNSD